MLTDEEIKQKQARIKENRDLRRALIDDRHMYLINQLERYFQFDAPTICDWLLDSQQLEAMQDFFDKGQSKVLFVICADTGFTVLRSNTFRIVKKSAKASKRLYFHLGQLPFSGETAVFLRFNNKEAITMKNIRTDVFACKFEVNEGFLQQLHTFMKTSVLPLMWAQSLYFGNLNHEERHGYLDYVENYLRSLSTIIACSKERVLLPPSKLPDQVHNMDAEGLIQLSRHPDFVNYLEESASHWMRQIDEEVKEVELLRVEREQNGPHGEFDFWKGRMTRMNSLVSELRRTDIQNVIVALQSVHSKTMEKWVDLDKKVTNAYNEAKENVKFLSTVEKLCVPLNHTNLKLMIKKMPNLLKALGLIYQHSTFYNTFSNMTVLFVKITNQIITSCKRYLTLNNIKSIWEQDSELIIKKMAECIELNLAYQEAYRNTRQEMTASAVKQPFNFSEVQIFGNMNLFTQRLEYLTRVLQTLGQYATLREFVLEGKEPLITRLDRLHSIITSKKYDYLDQRNQLFENDYEDFKGRIAELHANLLTTIAAYFRKPCGLIAQIKLQERLETLKIPELDHRERYRSICKSLRNEVVSAAKLFKHGMSDPPLDRNMPPFAGRIAWARSLYRRLEEPMNALGKRAPKILLTEEGQALVAQYNETVGSLVGYEITVYQTWSKMLLRKMASMSSSVIIFVKEPAPFGRPYVNMDPEVLGLLREIECLDKLQCPIPKIAEEFWLKGVGLKDSFEHLKLLCNEYVRITKMVPQNVTLLVAPTIQLINAALMPGITLHNWTSFGLKPYTEEVFRQLNRFEHMLDQAKQIYENRITGVLKRITNCQLISLPEDPNSPLEMMELVYQTKQQTKKVSEEIGSLSLSALCAAMEYINGLMVDYDEFLEKHNLVTKIDEEMKVKRILLDKGQGTKVSRKPIASVPDASSKGSPEDMTNDVPKQTGRGSPDAAKGTVSATEWSAQPESQVGGPSVRTQATHTQTMRTAIQIANAADDLMSYLGQKTTDAVCQAVRAALDRLWNIMATREAAVALKDVPFGKAVKCVNHPEQAPIKLLPTSSNVVDVDLISNLSQNSGGRASVIAPSGSRRSEVLLPQSASDEEIPQRTSVGGVSVGHVSLTSMGAAPIVGVSGSVPGSTSPTSTEMEGGKSGKGSSTFDVRAMMESDVNEQPVNCYREVHTDREVYRLRTFLVTSMLQMKKILFSPDGTIYEVDSLTGYLDRYASLWKRDLNVEVEEFLSSSPTMHDFQTKFEELDEISRNLEEEPNYYVVGAIYISTEDFKSVVRNNLMQLKQTYVRAFIERYISSVENIGNTLEEWERNLQRNINSLDDIAFIMDTLRVIREREIDTDCELIQCEEANALLSKFNLPYPKDIGDRVELVRCAFLRIKERVFHTTDYILSIQGGYKDGLLASIQELKESTQKGPMVPGLAPQEALDKQIQFKNRFDNLIRKINTALKGELLFGLPASDYSRVQQIGRELDLLQRLYGLYNEVNRTVASYYEIVWQEVDMEKIGADLQEFQNKCKRLPKALKEWPAYTDLEKTINDFNDKVPLLEMMTNKAMKPRHWQRLADLTNYNFNVESENFTLKNMLDAPLLDVKDDVEDICVSAVREKDIEAKLNVVVADWANQELKLAQFKTRGELLLKGDRISEIIPILEDSLMILSSLMSNRYNAPFRNSIQEWVQKLSTTSEVLETWMRVQNLWVYLEAVFVGGDIAKQLPSEAKRFQAVDKTWIKVMERARDTPNVIACCAGDQSLQEQLPRLLSQLELCQKSLSGYLERKRLLFPRFFFVSDPVLLEILGQASDPHAIQAHLLAIFDNTKRVQFAEKAFDILAAFSQEDEKLPMIKPVKCEGHVEHWLHVLLKTGQASLHSLIRKAYYEIIDPTVDLTEFFDNQLAQIGLLGIQILWTSDATDALNSARVDPKIMSKTNKHFLEILNKLIGETTRELNKTMRTKYETLITIHVHQRDIFDDLCKQGIRSTIDFEWTKQTRTYFMEKVDKCVISITDVDFVYQNEFLGCTERLVITPLTDRCYITLAQALNMGLGGAPAGPAGTGKTETTKDMGRCLGKYVVVFNCSDQMDFRGLGRIFKGLAQSGSWGCFDEFNRIELPVLSVAAQQIAIILAAKREGKTSFIFSDGDHVELNPEFGLFLTMNPGYAGRQELPENLKINFRSVAMMVPDRQIIIRVKLAACGFVQNIILARKFYVLYKLCEEQLTKQVHYDFGLRNILSVLRTLGAARRANPNDSEDRSVMRCLRDMNLSKLVDKDEPLFMSLIDDLFPGIVLDKVSYPELQLAIRNQVTSMSLINHPAWNLKLFETQRVRHGMMTLGPSGAGKSCCINVLMRAMGECGSPHREMRMNPKAITAPEMFGKLDVATNDWTDGIFSTLWRRSLKTKKNENVWLVLDGPVDAIWIENLNSVLDDNKTLTLANGDRIPMAPNCKIIFEVHNIDNASPATVSRNGMVFMSSSVLNWDPITNAWLLKRPQADREKLHNYFKNSFPQTHRYVTQNLQLKMAYHEAFLVQQACSILGGLLPGDIQGNERMLSRCYVFSLMWSFGALLELDDRAKLEAFWRNELKLDLPEKYEAKTDTIFEYRVDTEGKWVHWKHSIEEYTYPKDHTPEFASILVPNVDNVRTDYLIDLIAKQGKAVLLIGEPGTAKTVMINKYMSKFNPETHASKSVSFSSATTPALFQRTIESFVEKRVGTTYGPPAGKKMTVFIDDINMPKINEWGDQIANEIVRQTMEMNGFYSLEKPGEFTNIVDIQFLAAMNHPGGGRNDIPERLKRQFCTFNCTLPSDTSIDTIFSVIGTGHYCEERGFSPDVIQLVEKLVPLTRVIWQHTKNRLLPTPAKFHYIFNLRDLSRVWQGMLNTISEVIIDDSVLLMLWKHELLRVIADRFISPSDTQWFEKYISLLAAEILSEEQLAHLQTESYFVDFMRDAPELTGEEPEDFDISAPKIYEPVESIDVLRERLLMFMASMNENIRGANMDLVFFKDAITHLVKISRVIRSPRGNALLVGVGGSGKRSLTRLASYIADYRVFQIVLTRSYNVSNLLEDLKNLYRTAGMEGKGVTFIFTDSDVKDEGFLEYINNILASGMISGLFARDEMDEVLAALVPIMKKEFPKRPPENEILNEYFMFRVRKNLHVVLCFSPVGEKFRQRALYFPGLISGCTIDWFQRWPQDALLAVAQHFLGDYEMACSPNTRNALITLIADVHDDVTARCAAYFERYRRTANVTPKSYISFIHGYKKVYHEQVEQVNTHISRLGSGLQKLMEAQESISKLSVELSNKEKELEVANREAEAVLVNVTQQTQAAEQVKNKVLTVKDKCLAIVEHIRKERAVAEDKLEAARPALEEAEEALNTIKPGDISTVRKLAKPPHLIQRIMDCVLLLFKRKVDPVKKDPERPGSIKTSWTEALKLMAASTFLNNLLYFPRDLINEETVDLIQPYLEQEDYNLEAAKKVCGNVAGLCSWTLAMEKFYWVNKEVIPLKDNLAKMESKLNLANKDLAQAETLLAEKEALLNTVREQYEAAMRRKQELADDADTCRRRMTTATMLIEGLSGEKVRWSEETLALKEQVNRLIGDALIGTAFLSYSGPFNQDFRNRLMGNWYKELNGRQIPHTVNLDLINMLTEGPVVSEWNLEGLPSDDLSVQNAIIVTQASRYPLLIDPQSQGKNWIKRHEMANDLMVTTMNHKYFRTHLEDSLSQGRPLLIEDIGEEIDPSLDEVLEKNFLKSGTGLKVKVGDKEIDLQKGFTLYFTTKLPNPAYPPEIAARTSIIDFTVTSQGLEDQLLARDLEAQRVTLIANTTANRRRILELENSLLYRLANTEGSLVDDQGLVDVLQTTKSTAIEVAHQLTLAQDTEAEITAAREEFRPVAARGSLLYFFITELSGVNPMYHTGLNRFLRLFDKSMASSESCPVTSKRVQNIINYMTRSVWAFTVRGMFKMDRTMTTLLLTLRIDLQRKNIRQEEFITFIQGGSALDLKLAPPKPGKWVTDMTWLNLVALSKLNEFANIIQQVLGSERAWRQWFDKEAPEEELIPCGYEHSLDVFRRLLLIRSWCPDRTMQQARKYITHNLGAAFCEDVAANMEQIVLESDPRTPLVGLLSMGADPTPFIEQAARRAKVEINAVSMGQGQEIHARRLVKQAMHEGQWVLLQNCHLCLNYVEELLLLLSGEISAGGTGGSGGGGSAAAAQGGAGGASGAVGAEGPEGGPGGVVGGPEGGVGGGQMLPGGFHERFRLWVTTEEHKNFPITFLQIAIKFTNEPPEGIKANLSRTYTEVTQDFLDTCVTVHWKIMLYALAFLHCTVQERRKFGPLGWSIPYEFNQSDFNASVRFIQNHLDSLEFKKAQKVSGIDWKCVRYMIAEIQYGGRVTDDFDLRLLITITRTYFQERMFAPEFELTTNYPIPRFSSPNEYLNYIANDLPQRDSPEALGLHSNAEITYSAQCTSYILSTIVSIQPKETAADSGEESGGAGKPAVVETREAVVHRMCTDMLSKLPPTYVPYQVAEQIEALGALKPMTIFLRQEVDRINKVIALVGSTLTDLRLAIDGTVVMNDTLKDALDCIYDARVPAVWTRSSWDSSTLGFWYTELIERNAQFSSWLENGRPVCFWMTGFFNPQGFLTAMRQEVSRMHEGWSLDSVVLASKMTRANAEDLKDPPSEGGVYVYGLFLEGAAWDRRTSRLVEPKPKILYDIMSVINIYAVQEAQTTKRQGAGESKGDAQRQYYSCPIYRKKAEIYDIMSVINIYAVQEAQTTKRQGGGETNKDAQRQYYSCPIYRKPRRN
ncbi:hypothetical protein T265_14170, partial [Opisthorchis viverrini]